MRVKIKHFFVIDITQAMPKVPTVAIYTDTDPSLTGLYPGLNSAALVMPLAGRYVELEAA